MYVESPHNRETRNMRLLLRKTVGTWGSRVQRAHMRHKLEQMVRQEGVSVLFSPTLLTVPDSFSFWNRNAYLPLLICDFTPSPTIFTLILLNRVETVKSQEILGDVLFTMRCPLRLQRNRIWFKLCSCVWVSYDRT